MVRTNIAVFRIWFLFGSATLNLRKEWIITLKCPVCSGKLDFSLRHRSATCHTCGWKRIIFANNVASTMAKGSNFVNAEKS